MADSKISLPIEKLLDNNMQIGISKFTSRKSESKKRGSQESKSENKI